jgi:ubiquitin C-terminal hydrolase
MSIQKEYTEASEKLNGGPGGWKCPCCNNYQCSPRKMKMKAHRVARRNNKQKMNIDLKNIDD